MRLKTTLYWSVMLIALISGLTSCSDDNQDEPDAPVEETYFDELAVLQNNLVVLDENGNVKEHIYGRVLDEATPDVVYVGVDNFDEAREVFSSLFASNSQISADGLTVHFSKGKGTAQLKQSVSKDGSIARADFEVEGLKYVSSMCFIRNTAWPENDIESFHKLGYAYKYRGWTGHVSGVSDDQVETFVCIREYKNGKPGIILGITDYTYQLWSYHPERDGNVPDQNRVKEILSIVRPNWDFFKAAFNDYGKVLLDENNYYYCLPGGSPVNLHTGERKEYHVNKGQKHQVLFYKLVG